MFKRSLLVGALAFVLMLPSIPAGAQGDRRSAAEAYARVVDYRLLIEKTATRRAAELPASEREAFIEFVTEEVDFDMTRFYAISAMVDLFRQASCELASFAATPEAVFGLALPALGAILNPIVSARSRQRAELSRALSQRFAHACRRIAIEASTNRSASSTVRRRSWGRRMTRAPSAG
jgi:hypothetical protein